MKRCLVTYDTPDWAFHGECLDMQWFVFHRYAGLLEVVPQAARDAGAGAGFDGVYASAWYDTRLMDHPRAASQLSSFSYWQECQKARDRAHLLKRWKWLGTKNREIHERLLPDDHPAPRLLYHQICPDRWPYQSPPKRDGKFIVGFAGHRQHTKGILLIEEAVGRIPGAELRTVEWGKGRIPQRDMANWYHGLNAYVCASALEGGPRTGLEAMLSGAPLITTRVGQVGEMVTSMNEALVIERTADSIEAAIILLMTEPAGLAERLSWNARQEAFAWALRWGNAWADFLAEVAGVDQLEIKESRGQS